MSDTEETKRRMSEDSSSSDEDSSLNAGKEAAAVADLDNSGFRVDGEPVNKPRKDSESSSSSSEEADEDSSKSESASKSAAQTSTSESANVKGDTSSSDTEDDVEEQEEDSVEKPVPMARKVSAPEEFTKEEIEFSKRQTVNLDEEETQEVSNLEMKNDSESEAEEEVKPYQAVEVKVEEVASEDEEDQPEAVPQAEPEPEVKPRVNGGAEIKRPQFRHSASSLSEEDIIPDQQNKQVTAQSPSPNSAAIEDRKKELFAQQDSPTPPTSQSPLPTRANANNLTKIYTEALESNNNDGEKAVPMARSKPAKDITQIYTQGIVKTTNTPPSSPKPVPSRSKDITQLYTGGISKQTTSNSAAVPPCIAADKLNPKKHNMSTAVDKDAIRQAYEDVRSDNSDTQWAVFKFDGNQLKATCTGKDFKDFKASFSNEDRGFGYIRINTGDEMSKRAKFVFVTWVGPSVSVMKKAKMSTDKAVIKDIIQNMSVELQFENHTEFSHDHFKNQVDKAAGARYGTGERAL